MCSMIRPKILVAGSMNSKSLSKSFCINRTRARNARELSRILGQCIPIRYILEGGLRCRDSFDEKVSCASMVLVWRTAAD